MTEAITLLSSPFVDNNISDDLVSKMAEVKKNQLKDMAIER